MRLPLVTRLVVAAIVVAVGGYSLVRALDDAEDQLIMQPGTEAFPASMVWSNEELLDATSLVSVRTRGDVAHLFLYEIRSKDDDVVSRCLAVSGTVANGSSCTNLESRWPDPVIGPTYIDGDRATVTIAAPAETDVVELHFAERTLDVVPVNGWAVVPTARSAVCPTFTATAHLPGGETIQGTSFTPCFPPRDSE